MDVELGAGQVVSLPAVDPSLLDATARIDALTGLQRLRSWVGAQEQVVLAAMVEPGDPPRRAAPGSPAVDKQFVREEIACALRVSPVTVNARLHTARELTTRLPTTLALLAAGSISMRAARFLAEAVNVLPDAAVAEVQRRVLGRALEDGMASLFAVLPAEDLAAVAAVVQAAADALPALDYPPEVGAADRRRADALVALTTAHADDAPVGRRHGRRAGVQVTVALSTLLGCDEQPAELAGHGPIPAALARRIATDRSGTWRRLVTDPLGRLLDYGRSVYRPPQNLTDHVIARDIRYRFPGCRQPAARCDLDHQTDWAFGGSTCPRNLEALCARHHALKHETDWIVTGDPAGTLTWTSPTGHTYLDPPGHYPTDTTATPRNGDPATDGDVGEKGDARDAA